MWHGEGASVTVGALGQAIAYARGVGLAWVGASLSRWAAAERGRFAPWLAVAMGAGVAWFFDLRSEPAGWIGPVWFAGAVAAARLVWRYVPARAVMAVAGAVALGFASAQFATWRAVPPAPVPSGAGFVEGVVRSVERLPEGRRVTFVEPRLGDGPALDRSIRIRLRDTDLVEVAAGDTLRVRALLRPPPPPAIPGGWDLQRDTFFAGSAGSGFAIGAAERIAQAAPSGVARTVQAVRDRISQRIMAALPGPDGAIAATLLTGTGGAIPLADRAAFRDSGLAHLLAVAGLHIGIVMGLAMGAARFGLALSEWASLHWPCKQLAATAALMAGAGYLVLTGMHVPILRSFAMAALVTLGIILGRRALSLRGLALAAVALMLATPWEVVSVSFQMSFSAVLALIAGYEVMQPLLARLRGTGGSLRWSAHHVVALALTSLLAGTASAPFAAYHFGHFQLYFILANLVAVPLTAVMGHAGRLGGVGPDADRAGGYRAGADGLGHRHHLLGRPPRRGTSGGNDRRAAFPRVGIGLRRTRDRVAGTLAHAGPPGGVGAGRGRVDGGVDQPSRGFAGVPGRAPDRLAQAGRRVHADPAGTVAIFTRRRAAVLGRGHLGAVSGVRSARPGALRRGWLRASGQGSCDLSSPEWKEGGLCGHFLGGVGRAGAWGLPSRHAGDRPLHRLAQRRPGGMVYGLSILSDRTARGDRSWVPPPPPPHRASPSLPMAASETLNDQ